MSQLEKIYEEQLNIKTTGRDDSKSNNYNYPYEPTNYEVLDRVAQSGYIKKKNLLIDYGCGKGRVSFFLAYQTGCKAVGVEYDERLYNNALSNLERYPKPYNVAFTHENAVEYKVPAEANRFFFFNPFSEEVLKKVLTRIKESYYENPRELFLFFYYPSDEYVATMMTDSEFIFEDEIDCKDLFNTDDPRERMLIFTMC